MTDPLTILAHHVKEAVGTEHYRELGKRLGLHPNYIFRAAHPCTDIPSGKTYNPVLSENALKLLRGLGLTIAPADDTVPTVAHICMMIGRMDAPREARRVAIAAAHACGLMKSAT